MSLRHFDSSLFYFVVNRTGKTTEIYILTSSPPFSDGIGPWFSGSQEDNYSNHGYLVPKHYHIACYTVIFCTWWMMWNKIFLICALYVCICPTPLMRYSMLLTVFPLVYGLWHQSIHKMEKSRTKIIFLKHNTRIANMELHNNYRITKIKIT